MKTPAGGFRYLGEAVLRESSLIFIGVGSEALIMIRRQRIFESMSSDRSLKPRNVATASGDVRNGLGVS
jgi:hypothetical protein